MSFLLWQIFFCLCLAVLIGVVVGWLLRRFRALERESELNNEISLRDQRITSLKAVTQEHESQISELGADLELWRSKVPVLEDTVAQRDEQVMSLTMDVESWKRQLPPLEAALKDVESEKRSLAADLGGARKHLEDTKMTLATRDVRVNQLEIELGDGRSQIDAKTLEFEAQVAEFAAERATQAQLFDSTTIDLEGRLNERDGEVNRLRDELQHNSVRVAELDTEVATLAPFAQQVQDQDASIASFNKDLRERDSNIRSLERSAEDRELAMASLQTRAEQASISATRVAELEEEMRQQRSPVTTQPDVSTELARLRSVGVSNEQQWRTRLRVAESSRQQLQAQNQRDNERIERLESQLRGGVRVPRPVFAAAVAQAPATAAIAEPASTVEPSPVVAADPDVRFLQQRPDQVDDLRKISGVGNVLQQMLNSMGIYLFDQVARFTKEDISWVDDRLKFKGRIERDDWMSQAKELHREKY